MYTKARLGEIKGFADIDNPYEPLRNPEFEIDKLTTSTEQNTF